MLFFIAYAAYPTVSFFYYLILTTILWGVADQFPQPQYGDDDDNDTDDDD